MGRPTARWLVLLILAAAAVPFTAAPSRAASPPTSSTTTPTTVPPTTAVPTTTVPPPYTVAFSPCGSAAGAPCTDEPAQVQLSYTSTPPAAVQIAWSSTGRPQQTPHPAAASTTLLWSDGTACGTAKHCWTWPVQMTDSSFILNGTYQVTVCDTYTQGTGTQGTGTQGTGTQATCQAAAPATSLGLAAPPGPPTHVQAASSGGQVTVTWKPPATAPPDLTGYTVTRAGKSVYACSTDGLGPAAAVPCPASLQAADHPGNGSFTYAVTAMRLNAQPDGQGIVASPPADAGPIAVGGYLTPPGTGGGRADAPTVFIPSPVIGGAAPEAVGPPNPTGQGPTLGPGDTTGDATETGTPGNLQYPADDPLVGKPSMAVEVQAPRSTTDVVPAGMLALAVLALAIAAHFLYLRVELGRIQAQLAEPPGAPG